MDNSFFGNIGNIILIVVAFILLVQILISPSILEALALLGLFLWALFY